jgi:alkanesulfonate monooxygenase SsuD/methylene tetrahydromethanopterin reductase-like flavin-dependent oxidoreductase (luciferase family)
VPDPERALRHPWTDEQLRRNEAMRRRHAIGTPEQVHDKLQELADLYDTDELMALTVAYDYAARRRSYELVAEVCGLGTTITA